LLHNHGCFASARFGSHPEVKNSKRCERPTANASRYCLAISNTNDIVGISRFLDENGG